MYHMRVKTTLVKRVAAMTTVALFPLALLGCSGHDQSALGQSSGNKTQTLTTGQPGSATSDTSVPLDFKTSEFGPEAFPEDRGLYWEDMYWYDEESIPLVVPLDNDVEGKMTDENGVLIVNWPGYDEPVYHPVEMALYGLGAYKAYEHTQDSVYLQRAEANAQAIVDGSEEVDGALWFPYAFPHTLHTDDSMTLQPPWYSGMAKGLALDLFSKLCSATESSYWCEESDKTFGSFLQTNLPDQSFAWVDQDDHLWLEEYVGNIPATQVINGHIYAALGLAEYARLTGNEAAIEMFNGAATTVIDTFEDYRVPGGLSYYCAADYCAETEWQPENYHYGVSRQFRVLGHLTDMPEFVEMQQTFSEDLKAHQEAQED